MNTRSLRSTSAAALTVLTTAALVGAGVSTAAADPPTLVRESCSDVLSRAAQWPGMTTVGDRTVRLYSDAYDLFLSRRAPCAPRTSATTDCHYGPFLVVRAC